MTKIYINENEIKGHIQPEIYGHFAEHLGRGVYEGIYVKEDSGIPNVNGMRTDVVEALKELQVPVIRWPGGCFADEYHWKDGIGPKDQRKKMVNTNWGGVVEDNSFGTHEYFELCRQLGCKTYVNGNVGSGTVQEMSEWVEYMTFDGISPMADLRAANGHKEPWKVDYFGVGNENWGCGGNMNPEYYGNLYRHYQTFIRQYHPDAPIAKICVGPSENDTNWTDTVLNTCFKFAYPPVRHGFMDGLSLHYYTRFGRSWEEKGSATDFTTDDWYRMMNKTLYMEELIRMHTAIMDQYDPKKEIGLIVDEWGSWYDVEPGTNPGFLYQQNTMRDALLAGINLNIFNNHSDRVRMACIAQMINVLQSVLLTEGDRMIKTPTYHVFHMYKGHQDADALGCVMSDDPIVGSSEDQIPALNVSASRKDGKVTVTVTNVDLEHAYPLEIAFADLKVKSAVGRLLTGAMNAHNTFDTPETVTEQELEGIRVADGTVSLEIPACAVVSITCA